MKIITGALGGRAIRTTEGPGYRPATMKVRGAIFSMLEARGVVWGAVRVLDLFAGSGSLGFEALSRGALEAIFIDKSRSAVECMCRTAEDFNLSSENCRILEQDVAVYTRRPPLNPFSLIFIDPPYRTDRLEPTIKNIVKHNWLMTDGFLVAEVENELKLDAESIFPETFALQADRSYGQTRIIVWQKTSV